MIKEYVYPSPIIAERIQQIFNENHLTDRQVGEILKVERKTILSYRKAISNPSIKFVRWLCKTYNVDVKWLLDLE